MPIWCGDCHSFQLSALRPSPQAWYVLGVGTEESQWLGADDDVVRKKLQGELARVKAAATPAEILGYEDAKDRRACFLRATKQFHPNRFARRDKDIRVLASTLFIQIKEAYELAALPDLDAAKRQAVEAREGSRTMTVRLPDTGARKALQERRREKIKRRLSTSSSLVRTAQIRAATAEPITSEENRVSEQVQFDTAMELLGKSRFKEAADSFKSLAVGRPSEKRYRTHMHYAQGRLHQQASSLDEARAEFKRALGLDTDFKLAQDAISGLPSEAKKRTGLFSKLFGK